MREGLLRFIFTNEDTSQKDYKTNKHKDSERPNKSMAVSETNKYHQQSCSRNLGNRKGTEKVENHHNSCYRTFRNNTT